MKRVIARLRPRLSLDQAQSDLLAAKKKDLLIFLIEYVICVGK